MLPNKLLELNLADDKELDIPAGAVIMFEEMTKGANPHFPKATVFLRYAMGNELRTAILKDKLSDLLFELDINVDAGGSWLKLTKDTGEKLVIQTKNVVGRMTLDEGCQVSVVVGGDVLPFTVKETRRQIKKWSEREVGRPEGLIEMPIPQEN